jgi:hypothetical protein
VFFDRLEELLGRSPMRLEEYEFRLAFRAAVAVELPDARSASDDHPRPELSVVATAYDVGTKRAEFDVSTADGTARLTIDNTNPRLVRLWVMLPSGRLFWSISTESATSDDDLLGHLHAALSFVAECFVREAEEANQ